MTNVDSEGDADFPLKGIGKGMRMPVETFGDLDNRHPLCPVCQHIFDHGKNFFGIAGMLCNVVHPASIIHCDFIK